jgi:hypothetical protein
VLRARFETQPFTPGASDGFGVAVHVGVGPTRVCGGGMTVAVDVGGRGLGVAGAGVFGARVGGDVGGLVGAVGDGVCGAFVVGAAEGMSVVADDATPLVSPQPVTRKTIATRPARQDCCAIFGEDAGGAGPRGSVQVRRNSGRRRLRAISPRRSLRWRRPRSSAR